MSAHPLTPGLPKDFLRPCVLLLLFEQPSHGYDLLERLGELGLETSDPGGVYRVLRKLESEGLVRSAWGESARGGPRCRTYHITREGSAELDERARTVAHATRSVDCFLGRYSEALGAPAQAQDPASRRRPGRPPWTLPERARQPSASPAEAG
ncbi:MAG: PadR family transcriptional regulator [Solirubrobacterales bacterium]